MTGMDPVATVHVGTLKLFHESRHAYVRELLDEPKTWLIKDTTVSWRTVEAHTQEEAIELVDTQGLDLPDVQYTQEVIATVVVDIASVGGLN